MINLKENQEVKATNSVKKISYKGELKSFPIYRIPIDLLYYNIQNDRIATYVSKRESINGKLNMENREEFNDILGEYIMNSNETAFLRTLKNIKALGQREPGIVLNNGVVIDGNRRFTCLRKIYEERKDKNDFYFEAVILDMESNPRDIKLLELEVQHGQDEKVDYNPIEKLVGIYNDVIKNKILTVEEYAKSIAITIGEMNRFVEQAEIMEEFLEYINAPEQFYIARELELIGPIIEIQKIKRITANDEWRLKKVILFDNLIAKPKNNISKMLQEIGEIMKSDNYDMYFEEHFEMSKKIKEKIKQAPSMDTHFIKSEIRANKEIACTLRDNFDKVSEMNKKIIIKKLPVDMIENVKSILDKIDEETMIKLSGVDRENFLYALRIVKIKIENMEKKMNE